MCPGFWQPNEVTSHLTIFHYRYMTQHEVDLSDVVLAEKCTFHHSVVGLVDVSSTAWLSYALAEPHRATSTFAQVICFGGPALCEW